MQALRLLVLLPLLLLAGCLATFREPIPLGESAPAHLLGAWAGNDEWGERRFLDIVRQADGRYRALAWRESADNRAQARGYDFTVARHGRRWYLSVAAPARLGGHFAFGGFELTDDDELVLYSLDIDSVGRALEEGSLRGLVVGTEEGEGVLIESTLPEVYAFLDDPANSDVFVEVARFQRSAPREPAR
ncbi:hypothetical protein [Geopseudomonas guangdongensis]|uniref:Lipoprotein n=1 Tax=Geopseudomonas guangdongensis TaxID=1245526 RepID=A0A1H2GX85_9GAMM|nr:hypothetical protein [Pseudomonas guangdongensis]MBP9955771.1 hypothetical protein [Pseudomonas sp.]SDU24223.1 hypothetical protein SAMN05216580_2016 [Pseudomonas guangdongensis]